jgi:hypothetical protein
MFDLSSAFTMFTSFAPVAKNVGTRGTLGTRGTRGTAGTVTCHTRGRYWNAELSALEVYGNLQQNMNRSQILLAVVLLLAGFVRR